MAMFTVTMVNGSHWDNSRQRREQPAWTEHAAFMDQLVDGGFVVLGGPHGDGEHVLLAVEATDESDIRERFANDPWIPMGVIRIGAIEPWTLWLDGRQRSRTD
jgi:uncharacterized protein YciI